MKTVLIDTSALYAILDADDANHSRAKRTWIELVESDAAIVCTNYILVESFALIQRRLERKALDVFHESIMPILHVEWVDEKIHLEASAVFFKSSKKSASLVDCSSFAVMKKLEIDTAFAFDAHFKREGFVCLG